MLIDVLEWCGLLVDYCDVLISCLDSFWRHPFTAEDPKFSQIYSDEDKITHLYFGWPKGEYIFSKLSFLAQLFL